MAWEPPRPRRGNARGTLAGLLMALALVAATVPAPSTATAAPDEGVPVRLGTFEDVALLEPADPRSTELQARSPATSQGLYAGTLADRGWTVDLVATETWSLGLVWTPTQPVWVQLEDEALVPVDREVLAQAAPDRIDREHRAPEDPGVVQAGSASPKDGVLQLALEGDYEYYTKTLEAWDEHQLQVVHLVNAIYAEETHVPFEVVDQRIATSYDQPVTGDRICSHGSDNVLRQFRDHREASSPTRDSERELAHLFTGKSFPSNTIGCAYIHQIDTPWAYGVSQSMGPLSVGDVLRDVVLVAHEIGHNFDGWHGRSMPTPGSTFELGSCTPLATIMNPCLGAAKIPTFSNTYGLDAVPWEGGLAQDGGNQPHMQEYGQART